jgi:hypothetical protein
VDVPELRRRAKHLNELCRLTGIALDLPLAGDDPHGSEIRALRESFGQGEEDSERVGPLGAHPCDGAGLAVQRLEPGLHRTRCCRGSAQCLNAGFDLAG